MNEPTVSVLIPAYNGAALIEETLASLTHQTLTDWEAIVVDDCSSDDTRAVVAAWPDPRVRLVLNDANSGPVRTRNRALAEARGRYIAGLDQDDLCLPDRFAAQVAHLDAHRDIALLGTAAAFLRNGVFGPSPYAAITTPALTAWLTQIENPLVWSSVMVRGEIARALDPFTRPDILYAEDFDLYHRIQPHGAIARLDEPLLLYRQHPGGASQRFTSIMRASAARVLAGVHADLFGDGSVEVGRLIAHHVMGGEPVPDWETLAAIGKAIGAIKARFLDLQPATGDDLTLIHWETEQRWGRITRAALRAGTVGIADVVATRPRHLGLGHLLPPALIVGGAVGPIRRCAG